MDKLTLTDIKALITFAKKEGLPSLKLNGLEVTLPSRDATDNELETLKKEVQTLKAVTNKLVMLMEVSAKSANPFKPFSNRVEGKSHG